MRTEMSTTPARNAEIKDSSTHTNDTNTEHENILDSCKESLSDTHEHESRDRNEPDKEPASNSSDIVKELEQQLIIKQLWLSKCNDIILECERCYSLLQKACQPAPEQE